MSSFTVTAEKLTIHPHPDPEVERLELAQVGEYRAVVGKGEFKTGDTAIYIPEQAVLPDELIDELGLTGKLAGKQKNRVKAVRLRGELSQGIVCQPTAVSDVDLELSSGHNFAELLGITKWVPEVPSALSGEVVLAPDILKWIDIENIKRYPNIFHIGEAVIATEKVHGSCLCVTFDADRDDLSVSSKGFASQYLSLVESEKNLYWRAVRANDVEQQLRRFAKELEVSKVAIYAEVYGAGVQDLHYGAKRKDTPGLAVFDIRVQTDDGTSWLEQDVVRELCAGELPTVPVLYEGPYDYGKLSDLAEGSTLVGEEDHIREGLVVRSVPERRSDITGGRAIAKFVSDAYLTRGGVATEYE